MSIFVNVQYLKSVNINDKKYICVEPFFLPEGPPKPKDEEECFAPYLFAVPSPRACIKELIERFRRKSGYIINSYVFSKP